MSQPKAGRTSFRGSRRRRAVRRRSGGAGCSSRRRGGRSGDDGRPAASGAASASASTAFSAAGTGAACFSGSFGRGGLSSIGDLHAAGEPGDALTERCALHPPPVGLDRTAAEFLGLAVCGDEGASKKASAGAGFSGWAGRGRGTTRRRLFGCRLPSRGSSSRCTGPGRGSRAGGGGAAARGRHDLVGAAEPGEDAADGGGTVDGGLRPAPVDLAPQLRHQAHARGRRQLPLLGHVADAAQILVDDLVALDPHEVPSGAGVLDPRPRR